MYIHEQIQKAVLPLLEKYDLQLIELIGEMNQAAFNLSVLSEAGVQDLIAELNDMPNVWHKWLVIASPAWWMG